MSSLTDQCARATTSPTHLPLPVTVKGSFCCKPASPPQPPARDSDQPASALPSGAAAGLVYSQTSVPRTSSPSASPILIDRQASRLKRLRCSVLTAARLHVQEKGKWKVAMLTTTYRPDASWQKNQISDLVRCIRKFLARKSIEFRYVWVQELTKRGRPHYHLLVWLPLGITLPKPDKQGWWPWGMTKIEWARNAIGYIAKYASKGDDYQNYGKFQKGARLHGNGGVTGDALLEQRWWKLPSWLRADVTPSDRVRRSLPGSGGGFFNPGTGEVYLSPWEVVFFKGQVYIQLKDVV